MNHAPPAERAARRERARASAAPTAARRCRRASSAGVTAARLCDALARRALRAAKCSRARSPSAMFHTRAEGIIAMQSTGQGGRHSRHPIQRAATTVCISFAAPTIASVGHARIQSVQPMQVASSMRAMTGGVATSGRASSMALFYRRRRQQDRSGSCSPGGELRARGRRAPFHCYSHRYKPFRRHRPPVRRIEACEAAAAPGHWRLPTGRAALLRPEYHQEAIR